MGCYVRLDLHTILVWGRKTCTELAIICNGIAKNLDLKDEKGNKDVKIAFLMNQTYMQSYRKTLLRLMECVKSVIKHASHVTCL